MMDDQRDLDDGLGDPEPNDEVELADARLEWARAARCLDIPEQASAVRWHVTACDEARGAVSADGGSPA